MKRELIRTNAFVRAFRRFIKRNPQASVDLEAALRMLTSDAYDPRLKTHKLKGELDGVRACSAGRDLRILFEFVQHDGREAILLLTVGTHDEVY